MLKKKTELQAKTAAIYTWKTSDTIVKLRRKYCTLDLGGDLVDTLLDTLLAFL